MIFLLLKVPDISKKQNRHLNLLLNYKRIFYLLPWFLLGLFYKNSNKKLSFWAIKKLFFNFF